MKLAVLVASCLLSVAVSSSCGAPPGPPDGGPGTRKLALKASADVGDAGVPVASVVAIAATVTDQATRASVAGQTLNYVVTEGGGSVFVSVGETGSDGVARNQWTLGQRSGTQTVSIRAIDPNTGAVAVDTSVSVESTPGDATAWLYWPRNVRLPASGGPWDWSDLSGCAPSVVPCPETSGLYLFGTDIYGNYVSVPQSAGFVDVQFEGFSTNWPPELLPNCDSGDGGTVLTCPPSSNYTPGSTSYYTGKFRARFQTPYWVAPVVVYLSTAQ